jgi:hypothetical protein
MFGQARSNLIEVPLYVLKPLEGEGMEESEGMQGTYGDNEKMSCGFFFKVGSYKIHYGSCLVVNIYEKQEVGGTFHWEDEQTHCFPGVLFSTHYYEPSSPQQPPLVSSIFLSI